MKYLDPEGFDSFRALVMNGDSVREVDDFVLGAMDHQNRRRHLRDLVDTGWRRSGDGKR